MRRAPIHIVFSTALVSAGLVGFAPPTTAQVSSPGFELFEHPSGIQLSRSVSGVVCLDADGPSHICESAIDISVTGADICDWSDEIQYPCTWYGYQFEYAGADLDLTLHCEVLRSAPTTFGPDTRVTGSTTAEYTVELDAVIGHVFHPAYNTYAPVAERVLVGEEHACYYGGAPLYRARYRLVFVPE